MVKNRSMRNIVAHEYFGVDEEIVWDIVQEWVPMLLQHVQRILQEKSHYESS